MFVKCTVSVVCCAQCCHVCADCLRPNSHTSFAVPSKTKTMISRRVDLSGTFLKRSTSPACRVVSRRWNSALTFFCERGVGSEAHLWLAGDAGAREEATPIVEAEATWRRWGARGSRRVVSTWVSDSHNDALWAKLVQSTCRCSQHRRRHTNAVRLSQVLSSLVG